MSKKRQNENELSKFYSVALIATSISLLFTLVACLIIIF